ncbi:hypothetical protein [Thalassotalea sp. PS06]|uniref:hypothetical protein n=1 Tax=Thalassotalea sp. PS06 TaxID=2594005 RepID=UPI00116347ED|nr:hypothetical protein [Thalassotalea sp. PS06]QDP01452.1 hypothetical protein FNC98_08985 [Thalassotalea sp. PS06]
MFKAINQANNEFDKGAKSLKLSNLRSQETKEGFWYAAVAAAILPSIPNIFVAFIIYALVSFMLG